MQAAGGYHGFGCSFPLASLCTSCIASFHYQLPKNLLQKTSLGKHEVFFLMIRTTSEMLRHQSAIGDQKRLIYLQSNHAYSPFISFTCPILTLAVAGHPLIRALCNGVCCLHFLPEDSSAPSLLCSENET